MIPYMYMDFIRKQLIRNELTPGRVLVIYGPRRIGKTTSLNKFLDEERTHGKKILSVTGDDMAIRELFASESRTKLLQFVDSWDIVAIDEAQFVPHIGIGVKMLIDAFPQKTIILTGSSSFEIASHVGEPLTGRHFVMTLYPISISEFLGGSFAVRDNLENVLIYGAYPEVVLAQNIEGKQRILNELISSYLYKDILILDKVRSPDKLRDVVRALAFQVGSEVSLHEVAQTVGKGMDPKTVGRYVDILEKMFVIKKVSAFSRNLRNEISTKAKYYFLDLGVRNAVIGQYQPLTQRNDIGALWENFVFMELYKKSMMERKNHQYYFWRTYMGDEIDIVREINGIVEAIEVKWKKEVAAPKQWQEKYPNSSYTCITQNNFDAYLFA